MRFIGGVLVATPCSELVFEESKEELNADTVDSLLEEFFESLLPSRSFAPFPARQEGVARSSISPALGILSLFGASSPSVLCCPGESSRRSLLRLKKLCDLQIFGGTGFKPIICTHSNPVCSSSVLKDRSSCQSCPCPRDPRIITMISPFDSPFLAETRPQSIGGNRSQRPVLSTSHMKRSPPGPHSGGLSLNNSSARQSICWPLEWWKERLKKSRARTVRV